MKTVYFDQMRITAPEFGVKREGTRAVLCSGEVRVEKSLGSVPPAERYIEDFLNRYPFVVPIKEASEYILDDFESGDGTSIATVYARECVLAAQALAMKGNIVVQQRTEGGFSQITYKPRRPPTEDRDRFTHEGPAGITLD